MNCCVACSSSCVGQSFSPRNHHSNSSSSSTHLKVVLAVFYFCLSSDHVQSVNVNDKNKKSMTKHNIHPDHDCVREELRITYPPEDKNTNKISNETKTRTTKTTLVDVPLSMFSFFRPYPLPVAARVTSPSRTTCRRASIERQPAVQNKRLVCNCPGYISPNAQKTAQYCRLTPPIAYFVYIYTWYICFPRHFACLPVLRSRPSIQQVVAFGQRKTACFGQHVWRVVQSMPRQGIVLSLGVTRAMIKKGSTFSKNYFDVY